MSLLLSLTILGTVLSVQQPRTAAKPSPDTEVCDLGWGPEVVVGTGKTPRDDRYKLPERLRRSGPPIAMPGLPPRARSYCPTRALFLKRLPDQDQSHFRLMSGIVEERRSVIKNAVEWRANWRQMTRRGGGTPSPPYVDFRKEMILIAAMGAKPTGGYQLIIEKAIERPRDIQVLVRHVSPGRRCGAIAAVTHPMDAARISASTKPISWIVQHEVIDC